MFSISANKGFQMTFANGWTVSVQFGAGNYCANKYLVEFGKAAPTCVDAEIAAWDADGTWYDFEQDTVKGWQSTDNVASFIAYIAGL